MCEHEWEEDGSGDKYREVCSKCGAVRETSWN